MGVGFDNVMRKEAAEAAAKQTALLEAILAELRELNRKTSPR